MPIAQTASDAASLSSGGFDACPSTRAARAHGAGAQAGRLASRQAPVRRAASSDALRRCANGCTSERATRSGRGDGPQLGLPTPGRRAGLRAGGSSPICNGRGSSLARPLNVGTRSAVAAHMAGGVRQWHGAAPPGVPSEIAVEQHADENSSLRGRCCAYQQQKTHSCTTRASRRWRRGFGVEPSGP